MSRRTETIRRACAPAKASSVGVQTVLVLLIGMGIALAVCGYVGGFEVALDASPATFRWASAIAFFAMAFGPRLPRWMARRLMGRANGHQSRERGAPLPLEVPTASHQVEWTAVASISLVAGIAVLLLPWLLSCAQGAYVWALHEFLWTGRTLGVLDVLIMLSAAPPFVILGTLAQCAHRLGTDNRRWHPEIGATLLCGAGLGLCIGSLLNRGADGNALVLRSAAVPLLIAGILAVWRSGPRPRVHRLRLAKSPLAEPESGNQWPVVLRLAIAVTTVTATSAVLVWVYVADALDMATNSWRPFSGGALLISAGLGMAIACRRGGGAKAHWLGAFGMRCALAGGALAAGMVIFNMVTRASYPGFLRSPAVWLLWGFGACLPMVVLSWALGGGMLAYLSRSADDPEAGAGLLQILLCGAGCACLAVAFTLLERVGSYPTLVAMALALLAMGGTLVIHDPYVGNLAHRLRLAGVFGGVLVMIFLMPEAGRHWLGHQQRLRGRMWESWWVTHDLVESQWPGQESAPESALAGAGSLIDWYRVRAGCRVGVVSLFGKLQLDLPASFSGRVDQWGVLAGTGAEVAASGATLDHQRPALQALRATRERFDVFIVALEDAPPEFARGLLAEGLLERAWTRLAQDAVLVCVLPEARATESAVRQGVAAPSMQSEETHVQYFDLRLAGRNCLGVLIDRGAGQRDLIADWTNRGQKSHQPQANAGHPVPVEAVVVARRRPE